MISRYDLLSTSRMTGMRPHQQEKHYIQTLILKSIYSRFSPVFKGGTALMFLEGLNRFSEDLDFTAQEDLDVNEMGERILRDLEYMGVEADFRVMNETWSGTSFRISAKGPLFTREIERCHVRVEMSIREKVLLPSETRFIDAPYPDVLPFSVLFMNPAELMAEKVRAIITREKARDLYDLWFLMRKGWRTEMALVDEKLSYYEMSFSLSEFSDSIESKRGLWKSELKPIIFGGLPDFDAVTNEVMENVHKWILGI